MRFISTVCLISTALIAAFAQDSQNCHLCELIVNDVFAMHPGGLNGVPDSVLLQELNSECEKYLANQPNLDKGCHDFMTQNGASFIAAMRMYTNAYDVCHAPPANVC